MTTPAIQWFLVRGDDAPGSLDARLAARPAHLARLEALAACGRLKLAGPIPREAGVPIPEGGARGSLMVAAFASQAEAEAWAADDPYVAAGVFAHVTVEPFLPVLP
jgi:uncharacterized protein YciI